MKPRLLHILFMLLTSQPLCLLAQDTSVYHTNGNAYTENCNCYTLTNDKMFESGSVWNKHKIDLSQSFDFKFNVNLGCNDEKGADGIVFVLQPISTSIGSTGEGMGFAGINPSIGVAIDTYQNGNQHDPGFDHISINKNGDVDHISPNNLAGPVTALATSENIEDCQWHTLRIIWDVPTHIFKAQMDGVDRVQVNMDLVQQLFNGDPRVFWGFTGATGGSTNRQRFCTSLNAGFNRSVNQTTCYPTPAQFLDSSFSFGSIVKWFWNFGDGTIDSVQNPGLHNYPAPGKYQVKLNILGNNGCLSDTFRQTIVMGSKPVADFNISPLPVCVGSPAVFRDASSAQFGTITGWTWDINHGQKVIIDQQPGLQQQLATGAYTIDLTVKTKEGCVSDMAHRTLQVQPIPDISIEAPAEACFREPVPFAAHLANPATSVQEWSWQWGDGTRQAGDNNQHVYAQSGKYSVKLVALGVNGCYSHPVTHDLKVYATHAFAGNDTIAAMGQPMQLHGSGGESYSWSPAAGLSNAGIASPVAVLQQDATYVLTTFTPIGCSTTDTIHIKVYKGPAIYVPSAFSPNNDGRNDRFRFIAAGMSSIDFFNVYNRYGQLVYSSLNPQGWDGTFNGKAQATGVYVWMIKGKDYLGAVHAYKGTVVLVR